MKAIEVHNLTKLYGKAIGIQNVNFDVGEGEIFGFIGPNGAGKSTTIRTLLNLIFPTSGNAQIFGYDIVKKSKEIKKIIGYLPAEVNYYHKMNARQLLEYSARFFNVPDYNKKINDYSEILSLDLTKKISDLSSGNKKKVSIIQALLHNPKLLILDEPTSGLDPLIQSLLFDILFEERKRGTTIFYSSHVLSEVQKICDRVGIIKDGSVIRTESISELRKNQLKKVNIDFVKIPDGFFIQNAVNSVLNGNRYFCIFDGDINELTIKLSQFHIVNLTIEDPSLEEIFLHFYQKEQKENHE